MAKSLERRVEDLEGMQPRECHPHGYLSVDIPEESLKEVSFRLHGYYLEPLDADSVQSVPRIRTDGIGIDFDQVMANVKRSVTLERKLQGLEPREQEKIAKRHGYRIIYAPAATKA